MPNSKNDTEGQGVAELLLSALRTAALKAKLDENEISTIGIALKGGLITPDLSSG